LFTNITAPAVWYSIQGTDEIVQVSLIADFDTQLSIYKGTSLSCDALSCVATNDDSQVPGKSSILTEQLERGTTYYILVHGFGSNSGDFVLEVATLEGAANDNCTNAVELVLGEYVTGSTLAASSDEGLPFCGE
jgi:hypothetical protein